MSTEINSFVNGEPEYGHAVGDPNAPSMTPPLSSHGSVKTQKSKKRRDQKTFNLVDLFNEHQSSVGNWADAAAETSYATPDSSARQNEPEEVDSGCRKEQPAEDSIRSETRSTSFLDEHASHSRHQALLPGSPLIAYVSNISYDATQEELFFFFGGEDAVDDVRITGRGSACITFTSRDALERGLQLDKTELLGRPLVVSLCDTSHQRSIRYNQNRSNSNAGLPPHPPPSDNAYHRFAHSRSRGQQPQYNRNYDTFPFRSEQQGFSQYDRRNDYGQHSLRYPHLRSGQSFPGPRHSRGSAGYNYGPMSITKSPSFDTVLPSRNASWSGTGFGRGGRGRNDGYGSQNSAPALQPSTQSERHERPKLMLKPRTKVSDEADSDLPARPSSIFGEAKPVDTYRKEMEAEERLRLEEEELRSSSGVRSRKTSSEFGSTHLGGPPVLTHGNVAILKPGGQEDLRGQPPKQTSQVDENLENRTEAPTAPLQFPEPPSALSNTKPADSVAAASPPPNPAPTFPAEYESCIPPPSAQPQPARQQIQVLPAAPSPPKDNPEVQPHGPPSESHSTGSRNTGRFTRLVFTSSRRKPHHGNKYPTNLEGSEEAPTGGNVSTGGRKGRGGHYRGSAVGGRGGDRRLTAGSEQKGEKKSTLAKDVEPKEEELRRNEEGSVEEVSKKSEVKGDEKKESRSAKREKKKQAANKAAPKLDITQPSFSSKNKYAALNETNE